MENRKDISIENKTGKVVALALFVGLVSWMLAKAEDAIHTGYNTELAKTFFYAIFIVASGMFYDVAKACFSESSHPPIGGLLAFSGFGVAAAFCIEHGEIGWYLFFALLSVCAAIWSYRHFHK